MRAIAERSALPSRDAEAPPEDRRGILTRMYDGAEAGAGGGELGISRENLEKYPTWRLLQIPAQMAETVPRTIGATIGGLAGLGGGLAEHFGMSKADADRLQRDFNVAGTIAALLWGAPRMRAGAPPPASRGGADANAMQFDRKAVSNEPPPRSQQPEMQPAWNRSTAEWSSSPTGQYSLFPAERARSEPAPPPVGEQSTPGWSYGQQPSRGRAPTVAAPAQLTDEEAREAIKVFRSTMPRKQKQEELLKEYRKPVEEDEGVVAVTKGESKNEFGVNSGLRPYKAEDRAAANRLRDRLIEKYPDLPKRDNKGQWPYDAVYHAETTLLLRLADQNGGSLAGRKLVIHTDGKMCPSCRELLPYIGLDLGNPTVTFIDQRGQRLIMRDGKPLERGRAP
jgi:hypothetical protein